MKSVRLSAVLSPALTTNWKGVVSQKTLMDRKGHYLISIFVQLLSISDAPRTHKVSLLLHEIECPLYVQLLLSYLPAHVIIIAVVIIILPELTEGQ